MHEKIECSQDADSSGVRLISMYDTEYVPAPSKRVRCLKLCLEQSSCQIIQNTFFNEWTHYLCDSNLLVFAPAGVILLFLLITPDALHDSVVAEMEGL